VEESVRVYCPTIFLESEIKIVQAYWSDLVFYSPWQRYDLDELSL